MTTLYGYCACGCGQQTNIASQDDARYGNVKGQPYKYAKQHHNRRPVAERFWEKVDKQGNDECWPWKAYRNPKGYGSFGCATGKAMPAHRFSYELNVGPIPDGSLVMHRCDNPACVNPAHLRLGTNTDNMQDMAAKGRSTRGRKRK